MCKSSVTRGRPTEDLLADSNVAAIPLIVIEVVNATSSGGQVMKDSSSTAKVNDSSNGESDHRFDVAISFAGDNKRDKDRQIADLLRTSLGYPKQIQPLPLWLNTSYSVEET